MGTYSQTECLGYSVFSDRLDRLRLGNSILVNTINQYSYCLAEEDSAFKKALLNSDVLLPDGVGIVIASKILDGNKITKIAGADIHLFLLQKLEREKGSCFYMGASQSTLNKIRARMIAEYPNIRVGTYSPPFKLNFTAAESQSMIKAVNDFGPDVLFIGMTAPKQEKWAYTHRDRLQAGLICSIGAVFDFYAGTIERPSQVWIDLGLEWLGRLFKEPKRMAKRYIYYGGFFLYYLVRGKIRIMMDKNKSSV